jgi:hypothetical protein
MVEWHIDRSRTVVLLCSQMHEGGHEAVAAVQRVGGERMRVLVAVEQRQRAYAEAVAEAIGTLRPRLKVSVATPEGFEEELALLRPELVVCDRAEPAGSDEPLAWVEFLVDSDRPSRVRVGRRHRELTDPSFVELLAIVDEAWTLRCAMPVVA